MKERGRGKSIHRYAGDWYPGIYPDLEEKRQLADLSALLPCRLHNGAGASRYTVWSG